MYGKTEMSTETGHWSGSVEDDSAVGMRLDRYLCEYLNLFNRSRLKQMSPRFILNNKEAKPSSRVAKGDMIHLEYHQLPEPSFEAEEMKLDILYEDNHVIVVNKPQGLVVHPAAGNWSGTLVQGLLHHCREMEQLFSDDRIRPGIVHRLDKDTSGVIIAAKDPDTREFLSAQFAKRKPEKQYIALVKGALLQHEGSLESCIARDPNNRKRFTWSETKGKAARTDYKRLKRGDKLSLVKFRLITGRTHQIRVHAAMMGHPVIGDEIYSRKSTLMPEATLMLHAYSLAITLPGESEKRLFTAPLPERFQYPLEFFLGLDPCADLD
jgi:23S rRNA pseudouridine1911/1915/1917 synthase